MGGTTDKPIGGQGPVSGAATRGTVGRASLVAVALAVSLASPGLAQSRDRVGAYYGVDLGAAPHPGAHHVGVFCTTSAFGIVEAYPAVEVFFNRLGDGSVWQASLNLRVRPKRASGKPLPFYAGGGLNVRTGIFEPGLLAGVEAPWNGGRPFFEFRFFGTDIDRASYDVLVGVSFAVH